jgi:hypothetical protein
MVPYPVNPALIDQTEFEQVPALFNIFNGLFPYRNFIHISNVSYMIHQVKSKIVSAKWERRRPERLKWHLAFLRALQLELLEYKNAL